MASGIAYRVSTLAERKAFYRREFSVRKAMSWFSGRSLPQLCAVDAGSDTKILVDKKLKGKMLYFPLCELEEKLGKYMPEDVYYDRNTYGNPSRVLESLDFRDFMNYLKQELAFDIDVDNIPCSHPKGVLACDRCIDKAYSKALEMKGRLEREFRQVRLVYSGRGFHLHVLDEKAYGLTVRERGALNRKFSRYPIDPWVSHGRIRLIRMPYTLNSLVSRIALPVDPDRGFDPQEAVPRFLKR